MTREEFKKVKVGNTLIEGKDHKIVVNRIFGTHVEYVEDGYYHETNYEYVHFPQGLPSLKAWQLIIVLLKHPFADVVMMTKYNITHTRYNRYCKEYTLDSITNVLPKK